MWQKVNVVLETLKISAGKGGLFGLIIATGGIGVALVDYVKDWVGYVK